jgi:HSP20 family protein
LIKGEIKMKLIRYQYPNSRSVGNFENWFDQILSDVPRKSGLSDLFWEKSLDRRVAVDLFDDEKSYYVKAELPGLEKKDVNVELENLVLTINAERLQKQGEEEQNINLSRSIDLPEDIDVDKVKATMESGVLTISVPKTEAAKPKAITIN